MIPDRVASDGALRLALQAAEVASEDPARAEALLDGFAATDPEAEVVALRARGLAALRRGALGEGVDRLTAAAAIADRADLPQRAAEARVNLTYALFLRGDTEAALAAADAAAPHLSAAAAGRLLATRALIEGRIGRLDEAIGRYEDALATAQRQGDRRYEAMILGNLVWLHAYRGEGAAADAHARVAIRRFRELDDRVAVAGVIHNLGFALALAGDVSRALRHFAEAEQACREVGGFLGQLRLDRAEALLSVGVATDARDDAAAAVAEASTNGNPAEQAEAQLMLARAALAAEDPSAAETAADGALRAFEQQGRSAWAAQARHVRLQARWAAGGDPVAVAEGARATAGALASAGWATAAADARLIQALAALTAGRDELASEALDALAPLRRSATPRVRVQAWHAEALRRREAGNRRGAAAAVRAGLRALDGFRSQLGASELQVAASGHGHDLATLGVRLAREGGRPGALLDATERSRAASLRVTRPQALDDPTLAAALAELRAATVGAEQAVRDGLDPSRWLDRQRAVERRVAALVRAVDGTRQVTGAWSWRRIAERLGSRALVSYVALDAQLHAVTLADGRLRHHHLGAVDAVEEAVADLGFALRRVALQAGSARSLAAVGERADRAAAWLRGVVLPRRDEIDDPGRELVVVPSGALLALPWRALAHLQPRSVVVTPSATLWALASQRDGRAHRGPPVLAAGPDLQHAEREVTDLADRAPGATVLVGEDAHSAAVRAALDGAAFGHLACHGRLRTDNPLFSSLAFADGPLYLHDLEGIAAPPPLMVLSACDVGVATQRPGDELLGLAVALLGLGSASVVASLLPVADDVVHDLMLAFHGALEAHGPAAALAVACAEVADQGPRGAAAAAAFACLGAG